MKYILKPRKLALQFFDMLVVILINTVVFCAVKSAVSFPNVFVLCRQGLIMILMLQLFRIIMGSYRNTWRYARNQEYLSFIIADSLSAAIFLFICYIIHSEMAYIIYNAVIFSLTTLACITARIIYQLFGQHRDRKADSGKEKVQVAIIGAGITGTTLAYTLKRANSDYWPYCFIDSNKEKVGSYINGIRVYNADKDTAKMLKTTQVRELIIAINKLTPEKYSQLVELFSNTNLPVRIFDYATADASINIDTKKQIRDIRIEDLLFRDSINFEDERLYDYYSGKVILVTGGGGSIGSELCKQIAYLNPKKLIILDIYENNAYEIQQWLINKYGDKLNMEVEIASVRDRHKIDMIFRAHRPDIVFHAAAHKHVPLMEHCCDEAVKNNVFGTYNMVNAAENEGVKKFITISTDKAVNPTNIMGATKRLCEMMIRSKKDSETEFMAVRFGNVLGSNGSVIPLFKNQIENGGPVTITDKRIIRYFMTISEAVQLVMQAGVNANKADIFVLDMGKPVKILTLAENLIKLSGLKPYEEIDIVEIGLRPGEKLYEELLAGRDDLITTDNKKIFIEHAETVSAHDIEAKLELLNNALMTGDNDLIKSVMMEVVPTFKAPDELNKIIQ